MATKATEFNTVTSVTPGPGKGDSSSAPIDVVGINVKGIAKIKAALEAYKKNVNSKTQVFANKANIQKAIKGTKSEAACVAAAKELDTEITELLSFVQKFEAALDNLENQYKTYDKSASFSFKAKSNEGTVVSGN